MTGSSSTTFSRATPVVETSTAEPGRWHARGKVFIVIRKLANRSGGAERLYCELANMLARDGYDVTCLYCEPSQAPPFYPLDPEVTRLNLWGKAARKAWPYRLLDGAAKYYAKARALAPADWLSKNGYFVRRLYIAFKTGKPDLVISFMPPANTPTLIAGKMAGVRTLPTNHNVPEKDFRSPERWDQNPIDRYLRLKAHDYAFRIHTLFPTFAAWFPEHLQSRMRVIYNYVAPEFYEVDPLSPRDKEVIGVGRLAGVKNYEVLVEAWALIADEFPDWHVSIYGVGPDKKKLQALIADNGLAGKVRLKGHRSDIIEIYRHASILAHPAHHEGFGLSVAEALACGLPVVAFADCDGVKEFVHDEDNGLMVNRAGGARAYADALARIMRDDALRQRLRQRARPSVAAFNVEQFKQSFIDVIEEAKDEEARGGSSSVASAGAGS